MFNFKHLLHPLVFALFAVVVGPIIAAVMIFVSHDWIWICAWPLFTIGATSLVFVFEVLT